ncbi:MAG TPA: transposase, partial [Gammaproteobacteria bacterium]|nr:transposase [Gammaproteobacteria bacterium]
MAIMLTNTICWARFERAGLGRYSQGALSWMFRHAKLPWGELFQMSVTVILRRQGIKRGLLVVDDTDKARSKTTRTIAHVHKLHDKASGGFIMGQNLVFLLLVSELITVPVGFAFYEPDPVRTRWAKQDWALKKQGVAKRQRPPKPPRNPAYPTKLELGLRLLGQFRQYHPTIRVRCVLADALYGSAAFVDTASAIFGGVQVISQLRSNQKVRFRNRTLSVAQYFARTLGGAQQTSCAGTHIQRYRIRGGEPVTLRVSSARLYVDAQGKKRFVVALKYEGETEYRYLVASDLTWRTEDIVQAFTLRWLVEVFFEDWKGYEGWSALTMQPDAEGSSRSLILSLLVDQCLLLHPDQLAQLKHRQPAFTVGSLINRIKLESVLT